MTQRLSKKQLNEVIQRGREAGVDVTESMFLSDKGKFYLDPEQYDKLGIINNYDLDDAIQGTRSSVDFDKGVAKLEEEAVITPEVAKRLS